MGLARHEAAHCLAAQALGLRVRWSTVERPGGAGFTAIDGFTDEENGGEPTRRNLTITAAGPWIDARDGRASDFEENANDLRLLQSVPSRLYARAVEDVNDLLNNQTGLAAIELLAGALIAHGTITFHASPPSPNETG
jgi:hypothetical protein